MLTLSDVDRRAETDFARRSFYRVSVGCECTEIPTASRERERSNIALLYEGVRPTRAEAHSMKVAGWASSPATDPFPERFAGPGVSGRISDTSAPLGGRFHAGRELDLGGGPGHGA